MGFFDRIFASSKGYQPLDESSSAADCIDKIRDQLESLSKQVHQPLEVIPGDKGSYVFIGKPPKDFGVAWIEGDKLHSLKALIEEQGGDPALLKEISENLRKVYEANLEDARYTAKIGRKNIVVTPSDRFRNQVNDVIRNATH